MFSEMFWVVAINNKKKVRESAIIPSIPTKILNTAFTLLSVATSEGTSTRTVVSVVNVDLSPFIINYLRDSVIFGANFTNNLSFGTL